MMLIQPHSGSLRLIETHQDSFRLINNKKLKGTIWPFCCWWRKVISWSASASLGALKNIQTKKHSCYVLNIKSCDEILAIWTFCNCPCCWSLWSIFSRIVRIKYVWCISGNFVSSSFTYEKAAYTKPTKLLSI